MSDSGPTDTPDLSSLELKPQWVDQLDEPSRYESFKGESPAKKRGRGDGRFEKRSSGPGGGGRGPGGGDRRPSGDQNRGGGGRGPGGGQRSGGGNRSGGGGGRGPGGGNRRRDDDRRQNRPQRPPLYELLDIELLPEETGVQAVAKQIKMTGRCYPVFDLAKLVLEGPERFVAKLTVKKGVSQIQLVKCLWDDSLWLSKDEAMAHFRRSGKFDEFYKKEKVEQEPPKGNFTVVAVCGLSGEILGPSNFHDYQLKVAALHQRRFSRMEIDYYKRKIRMVRDEETLEKWRDSLKWTTHFTYLKTPEGEDPLTFKTVAEAEKHFIENHSADNIATVESATVRGNTPQKQLSGALFNMVQRTADRQKRFLMDMVKNLSPHLEKSGLKFFKIGKKATFVARSRPQAWKPSVEMSPRIQSIVRFVQDNPGNDLNVLVSALAPNPAAATAKEPTPEEVDILKDLRWLIREGFVLEFSNGELRMANARGGWPLKKEGGGKQPAGKRPPKKSPKPQKSNEPRKPKPPSAEKSKTESKSFSLSPAIAQASRRLRIASKRSARQREEAATAGDDLSSEVSRSLRVRSRSRLAKSYRVELRERSRQS